MSEETKFIKEEEQPANNIEELHVATKNVIKLHKKANFFTILVNFGKKFGLFFWYLFQSFCSKIYTRQKIIRNQIVLITGSGGYLGRQLACELSKHGVSLVLWDKNADENQKTYEALRALGHRRIYLHTVDLTNEIEVRECARRCKEKHGCISMIILAAATPCDLKTIFEKDETENQQEYHDKLLVKSFRLFYESHVWLYQEFLPKMIEKNSGHLVVITSESTVFNIPLTSTYSSLKQAQIKLVECVNAELSASNRKNNIKYSVVNLGMLKEGVFKDMSIRYHSDNELIKKYGIDSKHAAKRIVDSILKNQVYIYIPKYLSYVLMLKYILPTKCFDLLFSANNFMDTETLVNYTAHKKND